jgi:hypothetical protein
MKSSTHCRLIEATISLHSVQIDFYVALIVFILSVL